MPSILLPLTLILPIVECHSLHPSNPGISEDQPAVRPLLKLWSERFKERTRNLVIVFDECDSDPIRFPRRLVQELGFSTRTIMFDTCDVPKLDLTMSAGNCVLLLFVDVLRIRRILVGPHFSTFWRPENMYVLRQIRPQTSHLRDEMPYRFLRWALERLWRHRGVHRVVVSIGGLYVRFDPFLSRYYPESNPLAENRTHKTNAVKDVFVGLSVDEREDVERGLRGWYVLEEKDSFDGYPLRISAFDTATMMKSGAGYSGIGGAFLKEVCRMMNVTPVFRISRHGFGWSRNGVFVGSLADIVYRRADVTFNEFFVKDYLTREIDSAMYLTCDHLCLLVPKAPHIPEYLAIVRTFTLQSWILIFATHLLISMIYKWMRTVTEQKGKRLKRDDSNGNQGVDQFYGNSVNSVGMDMINVDDAIDYGFIQNYRFHQAWRTTDEPCDQSVQGYSIRRSMDHNECHRTIEDGFAGDVSTDQVSRPGRKFHSTCLLSVARLIAKGFMHLVEPLQPARPRFSERFVLICSLIMGLVLNGIFTSKLTSSFSKLDNFEDIHTLEEFDKTGLPILTNSPDLLDDALSDDDSPVVTRLRAKMKYVNYSEMSRRLFETKDAAILRRKGYMRLRTDEGNKKKVHVVEECPKLYTIAPLVTKGSPFVERINTIIGRLHNGGFYEKWFEEIASRTKRTNQGKKKKHRKLTMRYLSIPFAILLLGLGASLIAFAYECAGYHE